MNPGNTNNRQTIKNNQRTLILFLNCVNVYKHICFRVMLKFEQMHVLVPTHAFLQRCANKTLKCPRFGKPYDNTSIPTRWWRISVRHIIKALRKPFFAWTKVQMVRFGKRTNRTPLRLKKVTTSFKPQKTKRIYSCSYICL